VTIVSHRTGEAAQTEQQIRLVRRSEPTAVTAFRHHAAAFAAEQGAPPELTTDVALAVSEAVTNAVKHAQAGCEANVELHAAVQGGWLVIRISDQGQGFGELPSDGLGLGLTIIARFCSDFEIVQAGVGTQLLMRFALPIA
jgi:serine/threonine-protein kinase RsbW